MTLIDDMRLLQIRKERVDELKFELDRLFSEYAAILRLFNSEVSAAESLGEKIKAQIELAKGADLQ